MTEYIVKWRFANDSEVHELVTKSLPDDREHVAEDIAAYMNSLDGEYFVGDNDTRIEIIEPVEIAGGVTVHTSYSINFSASDDTYYYYRPIEAFNGAVLKCAGIACAENRTLMMAVPGTIELNNYKGDRIDAVTQQPVV